MPCDRATALRRASEIASRDWNSHYTKKKPNTCYIATRRSNPIPKSAGAQNSAGILGWHIPSLSVAPDYQVHIVLVKRSIESKNGVLSPTRYEYKT